MLNNKKEGISPLFLLLILGLVALVLGIAYWQEGTLPLFYTGSFAIVVALRARLSKE